MTAQLIFQYSCIYNFRKRRGAVMIVYMDLENLLKEKNISKNKLCEACNLQRTQLNNYCKNKVSRIDFTIEGADIFLDYLSDQSKSMSVLYRTQIS